ncbi:hypothetical protein AB4037_23495 [Labrys sp. KB_33_2]|uniref:hypothetical protein n=1 Tax=Labrys sp. KB_33_2 TaxID=3237479 RepID=UPI003F8E53E9
MAKLYITEFGALGASGLNPGIAMTAQVARQPPVNEQALAIGASSVPSEALDPSTVLVRLHADEACSILFGADPTATADSARLAAGQTEYFGVRPGLKIAVISNT